MATVGKECSRPFTAVRHRPLHLGGGCNLTTTEFDTKGGPARGPFSVVRATEVSAFGPLRGLMMQVQAVNDAAST
jgi:hypothetical protein